MKKYYLLTYNILKWTAEADYSLKRIALNQSFEICKSIVFHCILQTLEIDMIQIYKNTFSRFV